MDLVESGNLTILVGEGRTTVAIPLSKQEEMQPSRAQVDRLALEVVTANSPAVTEEKSV